MRGTISTRLCAASWAETRVDSRPEVKRFMPYLEEETKQDVEVERQRRRWAITGGAQRGKTTSLLTFLRPCAIVSCPDELGFGSLPKHAHEGGVATCLSTSPPFQL